ncbi:MAG: sensor histidine kinase, partial [Gloeobacteraceae cyanobacterium ES-bin-316]|nr:sensor histidine kinase [Ferruginibacter sp.]
MFLQLFNWRSLLALGAIVIVSATIFFSDFLSKKIASEEKQKIEQWVEAVKEVSNGGSNQTNLSGKILTENSRDIPMIAVTEKDSIYDHYNMDTFKIAHQKDFLAQKLKEFKKLNEPIIWRNPFDSTQNNKLYYGESDLLKQIRYFPLIQLLVAALFII